MARYYITTPIYYVNDAPHIGHAYTTIIADALARWHRLIGDDTWFLTGTDEHGLKIQRAAEANGLSPVEQADRTSVRYRETWSQLDITNDDFIRTTEPRHHHAVQALMQRAYDNGFITKGVYEGLYCVACEAYYTPDDLDGLNCRIHGRPVEQMREENYFFELSAFADRLLEYYTANPAAIRPEGYRNEVLGLLRQGLDDVSVSRTSITWGVPVPWDADHVFYVWYDALINYATAVGYGSDPDRFAAWWPAVHHVIGKDIIRFHCVYWPAMLLAAGVEDLPSFLVHGFLLVGGEKMSKSKLNSIAPIDLVDGVPDKGWSAFGVDGYRYHFLRDNSFGPDGDFSYEGMVARYNADLANQFGNLVQRIGTVIGKSCGGIGPAPTPGSPLATIAERCVAETAAAWERVQPSVALEATWRLIREINDHLQQHEPWKMTPGAELDAVMGDAIEALRIVIVLVSPVLVRSSEEAWRRLGLPGRVADTRLPEVGRWGGYPGGLAVTVGEPLFPRLKG